MRKYTFFNNEQALVFAASVNGRLEHIRHYEKALKDEAITTKEREFLVRQITSLRGQIEEIKKPWCGA